MTNEFGAKIRSLRAGAGLTQEQLAQKLSVTPQAVSKWESGTSMPDILLLPPLSVALGTSIDALFSMTDDRRMERIDNMLWDRRFLTQQEFESEERFLKEKCLEPEKQARATLLLAELYNKRAKEYREHAAPLARRALSLLPESGDAHHAVFDAENGAYFDWNYANHAKLIEFYLDFVAAHPQDKHGYQWLLDLLIADGRGVEAREYLEKLDRLEHSYHYHLYLGMILRAEGRLDEALDCWAQMTQEYPENGFAWFVRASMLASLCRYDEAEAGFRQALERMQPKYVDAAEALAQLAELRGNYGEAIGWYEKEIEIARTDWNEEEGELIDEPKRQIARLREKMEKRG